MGTSGGTPQDPSRRRFLTATALGAIGVAVGCGSDDGGDDGVAGTTTRPPEPSTTHTPPTLTGDPFTLGVASGDPRTDSVILWTRLAVDPTAADGLGAMPAEEVDVRWQVATDAEFADVIGEGVATASPDHAHAVHVAADGLEPATTYSYRFLVGDFTSPVGTTRTLPTGSPERFAVGVVNCQWFEVGAYGAYRNLVGEPIDLVLHLGDYIYEYPGQDIAGRSVLPGHFLETLADYRLRYASYRLDEDLQAAHAAFPWVLTWDDHEVANNYMDDTLPDGTTGEGVLAKRAAAYQAWWEHLPVRVAAPTGPDLDIYQSLDVGDLARIYVLDERQYAAEPPCRAEGDEDFGDCAERSEDRARLGDAQEAWLAEETGRGGVTWNLLGNPVVLAGVDGGNDADGPLYYLDTWDGFPTARNRLIDLLATVDNPVVLTGDYHAAMVLDVHERPFEAGSAVVAPEFMAPPISSVLFDADVSGRTPHLRQQINAHGYLTVEATPDLLTATFRTLADVRDPASAVTTAATWTVTPGDPVAHQA